jgi:hypothetical protein
MRWIPLLAALTAFALTTIATPRSAAANCGAEGCPLSAHGPEATLGRFTLGVRYQSIEQDRLWDGSHQVSAEDLHEDGGEPHEIELLTRTRGWSVDARARLLPRLEVSLAVPYLDRVHRHSLEHHPGFSVESEWRMKGVGDATAIASWTAFAPAAPGGSALVLQAGAKLPTGETDAGEVDGEQPEPPARLGSGSTDFMAGVQYRRAFTVRSLSGGSSVLPLSVGVSGRFNGRGTDRYRSGNEWQADLGASYPLARALRLLAQVNGSGHGRDDSGETDAEPHHTGGTAVFASPGLQADLLPGISAFGYYQFRIWRHTNGPQLVSPYHLVFGLGCSLH